MTNQNKTPQREAPYEDSGEWGGSRCPECTYYTYVDSQGGLDGKPNFCAACGNQLVQDRVLEIRGKLPEQLRDAANHP